LILGVGRILSLADVSWLFDELQPLPQEKSCNYDSSCVVRVPSCEKHTQYDTDKSTSVWPIRNTQYDSGLGGIPLEQVERRAILDTLRQTGGNRTKAAKVLGISDRTLRDKIHRYRQKGCLQLA